jgi:hypothetical protein
MDDLPNVPQTPDDPVAQTATGVWIGTKMQDMPGVYREKMPITSDPDILMGAEQAIRSQFRHDLKTTKLATGIHATMGVVRSQEDMALEVAQARADAADQTESDSSQAVPQTSTDPQLMNTSNDPQMMTAADKILEGLKASVPARMPPGNDRPLVSTQTRKPSLGHLDYSKMSTTQKIMQGLSQSRPAQSGRGTGPRKQAG